MLLAVFHNTYKFIRRHYYEAAVAWDSVIEELQAFAGLMIFLRSDWWRPWNELVCCSDASATGFGVCTSFWKKSEVAAVGRVKERSRFRRTQNHSARESSLTSAGFVRDELTGQWKAGEIESDDFLSLSGWALVDDFPEVPARFLRKDQWTPVRWGKWKHKEDILTLEARAAVMALKRVAMSVFGGNVRQLFLLDNMSLVLALERSRSRRYTLLKQVRIFNAYCISRGIQPSFRWVPSELNNADEPSRYDTDEPSKLLTDLIHYGSEAHSAPGHPSDKKNPSAAKRIRVLEPGQETGKTGTSRATCHLKPMSSEASFTAHVEIPVAKRLEQEVVKEGEDQLNEDESFSSDSSSDVIRPTDKRKRLLHSQAKHRRRKYVDYLLEGKDMNHLSLLERKAIGMATEKIYQSEYARFMSFAKPRFLNLDNSDQVDQALVDYMNHQFLNGHQAFVGDRLIASWIHHRPQYGRAGSRRMPRALRALKGWRKLCPGRSRTPYPLAVWCGMAVTLKQMGYPLMSVFLMICLSTYCRPSQLFSLQAFGLVPPATGVTGSWSVLLNAEEHGVPSKTGEFDVSISLNSPYLKGWGPTAFKALKKGQPNRSLWNFDYGQYLAAFKKASGQMGLALQPYHTRHSGPSIDRSRDWRSPLEVQKRGQWKTAKSVARYEKSARLAKTWELVPRATKDFCLQCEAHFGDVVSGRRKPPNFAFLRDLAKGNT